MNYTINTNKDLRGFIESYLIPKIQEVFVNSLNSREIDRIDDYLNSNKERLFNVNKKVKISSKNIMIGSIYNLTYRKTPTSYIIEVDPNQLIPRLDVKYITIANLINYGNMELNPYNIYDKTFDLIASKYFDLLEYYNKGVK